MGSRIANLATVIAISLVAALPAPAAARAGSTVSLSFQVMISGPTEVCRDTAITYDVRVVSVTGGATGTSTQSNFGTGGLQLIGGFQLSGSVHGPGTAGLQTSISGSSFPARFPREGQFTIIVQATSPLGYPIQAGIIVVNVVRCEYSVTMLGVWALDDGFRPWMVGVVDDNWLLRGPDGSYASTVIMSASAVGRLSIGCSIEYEVGDFSFQLRGQLPPAPADFVLDVTDGVGIMRLRDAVGGVICGPAGGAQSRPDPVWTDNFQVALNREGDAKYVPVTMHGYKDSLGQMVVILTKKP